MPFVPKSGGHSAWSTIGSDGFVLDLSLLRKVDVDVEKGNATASAGAQIRDVMEATWSKGFVAGRKSPVFLCEVLIDIVSSYGNC